MKRTMLTIAAALALGSPLVAQKHELGLTLGGFVPGSRSSPLGGLNLSSGPGFQANYGYRLLEGSKAALYAEGHLLANPLRDISSLNRSATRDVATLYVTPGVRLKFTPRSKLSPYLVAGGGYALYEQSFQQIDGRSNAAPRFTHRGVFDFGGGLDVKVWRFVSLRSEIRDFYSGSPSFNTPTSGGQHNVVAGGGFALRFR